MEIAVLAPREDLGYSWAWGGVAVIWLELEVLIRWGCHRNGAELLVRGGEYDCRLVMIGVVGSPGAFLRTISQGERCTARGIMLRYMEWCAYAVG